VIRAIWETFATSSPITEEISGVNWNDIRALWEIFTTSSPYAYLTHEMRMNFYRYYINFRYPPEELSNIRKWYRATRNRFNFFRSLVFYSLQDAREAVWLFETRGLS
jgi:hypothetical protein